MTTDSASSQPTDTVGWTGAAIAAAILTAWGVNTTALLTFGFDGIPAPLWAPAVLVQTFLHTGLFITAHDAMHGNVSARHPRLNDAVGRLATRLYALFPYDRLRDKHLAHHRSPASDADPDFHPGDGPRFWSWYLGFIGEYIGPLQLIGMAAVYNVLLHGVGVGAGSLLLFWVLPSLLSTFQLFYFGTYRPHLEPSGGYPDEHRAESNTLPPILSLLTCYHFGYHRAHHHFPDVPWWQLPEARRRLDAPSNLDETER